MYVLEKPALVSLVKPSANILNNPMPFWFQDWYHVTLAAMTVRTLLADSPKGFFFHQEFNFVVESTCEIRQPGPIQFQGFSPCNSSSLQAR
jgi:hypothetical protein